MSVKKVLVVEDTEPMRHLVKTILESHGFEVDTAEDGDIGLEKLASGDKYDLVILDVLMPRVNGWTVLEELSKKSDSPPVIMLTTEDMYDDLISGYNMGAAYYIPKPFTSQQLAYGVNMVLESEAT